MRSGCLAKIRWSVFISKSQRSLCVLLSLSYSLRVFPISVSWWFSTRVWVTESLFKPPGLFSVFWPIIIILWFGCSPVVLFFPSSPVPLPILWWLYRAHQPPLVSPSLTCSRICLLSSKVWVLISLFAFFYFYAVVIWNNKVHYSAGSLFLLTITRSGCLADICSKSQRSLCLSFSKKDSRLCIFYLFVWLN